MTFQVGDEVSLLRKYESENTITRRRNSTDATWRALSEHVIDGGGDGEEAIRHTFHSKKDIETRVFISDGSPQGRNDREGRKRCTTRLKVLFLKSFVDERHSS